MRVLLGIFSKALLAGAKTVIPCALLSESTRLAFFTAVTSVDRTGLPDAAVATGTFAMAAKLPVVRGLEDIGFWPSRWIAACFVDVAFFAALAALLALAEKVSRKLLFATVPIALMIATVSVINAGYLSISGDQLSWPVLTLGLARFGDLAELRLDRRFDLIVCSDVLHYLKPAEIRAGLAGITDMSRREIVVFTPLVVLTILFGVYPKPLLDMSAASVTALVQQYHAALGAAAKTAALVN